MLLMNQMDDSYDSAEGSDSDDYPTPESSVNEFDISGVFYPWECISIIRKDRVTVDFQISSNVSIMSLIHVLYSYVYKVKDPGFM